MSLIDSLTDLTSKLPFGKPTETKEYIFALNITAHKLKTAVWDVLDGKLEVLNSTEASYSSSNDLVTVVDRLLDLSLGSMQVEPEKILFGVPDSWLSEDDLKPAYLKILRDLVKALDLKPLAFVATSHALAHFLEKKEGAPATAILVGIEDENLVVSVIRAGKIAGSRIAKKGENLGEEVEKALLSFPDIEVLPSRILVYGDGDLEKHKNNLLSFSWMSRLSFLHFPKIEVLEKDIDINSVALAGAVEIDSNVHFAPTVVSQVALGKSLPKEELTMPLDEHDNLKEPEGDNLGFIQGDVMSSEKPENQMKSDISETSESDEIRSDQNTGEPETSDTREPTDTQISSDLSDISERRTATPQDSIVMRSQDTAPTQIDTWEDEEELLPSPSGRRLPSLNLPKLSLLLPFLIIAGLVAAILLLPKATVTVFVEPRVLERDTQVTADPSVKTVDETAKKIPGQVVETQVSGSEKAEATGKKQIGDPAKGTVTIYNKTYDSKTFSKGTTLTSSGLKFTLDSPVTIASQSATDEGISFGKATVNITASTIGPDGNLASGSELKFESASTTAFSAKAEGNFSGGTSKDVTVVTDSDQKKLLASLASNLRKQAVEQIQEKIKAKNLKILEEALSEEVSKKTYSKDINDQASEFTLNLTIKYKGTAYLDDDLKQIVSKLVETNVPGDFELNLAETETQADVSKLEKDGSLVFLARFKAKLIPKIDTEKIKSQIKGKTPSQTAEILKSYENVLGSEIKLTPSIPARIARLPFLDRNIKVEVSLK